MKKHVISIIKKIKYLAFFAVFFNIYCAGAQIPKLYLKYAEKQNKVQSGYIRMQDININTDAEVSDTSMKEYQFFFISTPKDTKYLTYSQFANRSDIDCKLAHAKSKSVKIGEQIWYFYDDDITDAKDDGCWDCFPRIDSFSLEIINYWKKCQFRRIPPIVSKKNIRYKIMYPDNDISTNYTEYLEFDRKTFYKIQEQISYTFITSEKQNNTTNILEQRLYEYVHPDILDTISFMFETLKKGADQQMAAEQAQKDSAFKAHFCDSIMQTFAKTGYTWTDNIATTEPTTQTDRPHFMPAWKIPSLAGDTIYSDSIKSRFLFIDMWYISCYPCLKAMMELATIDTLYDESLLKIVSINVADKDTTKIRKTVEKINITCDIACSFSGEHRILSQAMRLYDCTGYPQMYLIDMKTKQVIWFSCGWSTGFTKEIGDIINAKK